jgi:thioester reductase-like protein
MTTPTNLAALLQKRASNTPQKIIYTFLKDGDSQEENISYQELHEKAQAIAAMLQMHTQPFERVLLIYPPGLDYIAALFGCFYANVIAVPAYPPVNKKFMGTFEGIIENARPTLILSTKSFIRKMRIATYCKYIRYIPFINKLTRKINTLASIDFKKIHWRSTDNLKKSLGKKWRETSINPRDIAYLQYTSGSTASPKGVIISHENALSNLELISRYIMRIENNIGVSWLPPYHDMGLVGGIFSPMYCDFQVILMSPLNFLKKPIRWLNAISTYKATISCGPDFSYALCTKKITSSEKNRLDLSNWKLAYNGAEPLNPDVYEAFIHTFQESGFRRETFCPTYGLAEGTLMVSLNSPNEKPSIAYIDRDLLAQNKVSFRDTKKNCLGIISCGPPVDGTYIVDPHTCKYLPENSIGEIWISGKSVSPGYWEREDLNKEFFQAKISGESSKNYCKTGDLGFIHKGELYISGRIKDLIIIAGMNYYPHDIEHTVAKSHPNIRPGCIAAFSNNRNGIECLSIIAEVVSQSKPEEYAQIYDQIIKNVLMHHQLPTHEITLLSKQGILKTGTGKIQRQKNKSALLNNQLPIVGFWRNDITNEAYETKKTIPHIEKIPANAVLDFDTIETIVKKTVAHRMQTETIDIRIHLNDLGMSSIMLLQLQNDLHTIFENHCNLQDESFFENNTIHKISKWILQTIKSGAHRPETQHHEPNTQKTAVYAPSRKNFQIKNILLTGATGVLGGHILKTFLSQHINENDSHIYCLIRGNTAQECIDKIVKILNAYSQEKINFHQIAHRITIIPGDITEKNFGLSDEAYHHLAQQIDCTLHVAGKVSLHESYASLEKINVFGTENVVAFSLRTKNKFLLHTSTYAVMGDRLIQENTPFSEKDFQLGQSFEGQNYAKSKFNAERIVRDAQALGLHWMILRPGNIFGEATTGYYPFLENLTGIFYDILKTVIMTKSAMRSPIYFDVTPVDYVSKAILFFALQYQDCFNVFHLTNPHKKRFHEVIDLIKKYGHQINMVSPEAYYQLIESPNSVLYLPSFGEFQQYTHHSKTIELMKLHPEFFKSTCSSFATCEFSQRILSIHEIMCPKIDENLMKIYLDYCEKINYIPAVK